MSVWTLLMGSSMSSSNRSPMPMLLIMVVLLCLVGVFMLYSLWKKGVLFDNLIRSAIICGGPFLLAGLLFLIGILVGVGGCSGGGKDSGAFYNGGDTASYQSYCEEAVDDGAADYLIYWQDGDETEGKKA